MGMAGRSLRLTVVLLALAGAGMVAPAPASAGVFGLSSSEEQRIGAQAARQLEAKYGLVRDARLNNLVQSIGRSLVSAYAKRDLPYSFRILNNSAVNAVSLPGGYIYVFRGLLDFTGDDRDMLAGVLAHELGHSEGKHHSKMAEREMIAGTIIGALTKGSTRDIASLFANVYALKWSRSQEYDADKRGVRALAEAGYDPNGLVRFLDRLSRQDSSRSISWLSTHPEPAKRVTRARAEANAVTPRRR